LLRSNPAQYQNGCLSLLFWVYTVRSAGFQPAFSTASRAMAMRAESPRSEVPLLFRLFNRGNGRVCCRKGTSCGEKRTRITGEEQAEKQTPVITCYFSRKSQLSWVYRPVIANFF
jgi:hypothetical protein